MCDKVGPQEESAGNMMSADFFNGRKPSSVNNVYKGRY